HMEDVFELLKQRKGGLDRAAIDVLLECLDALEAAVDSIEADGTEHLDPTALNDRLQALVRAPEPEAEAVDDAPDAAAKAAATVRVDAERLDQLMHSMGELVVHRTLVESLAAQADVPGLSQAMQELTRSSQALQAMVMQIRMIPVDAVFMRFPRLVRDLS